MSLKLPIPVVLVTNTQTKHMEKANLKQNFRSRNTVDFTLN